MEIIRCPWAEKSDLDRDYHDNEWGKPLHDERRLFEMLILEGQQAGLSWSTILAKRENFRLAYDHFDPEIIALYDSKKIDELLQNSGIIRNKLKINAAIENARAYIRLRESGNSLENYLWSYVDGNPIINNWEHLSDIPVNTPLSDTVSKDMKKKGFKFVGSISIYAYLQSIGIIDDHLLSCFVRNGAK